MKVSIVTTCRNVEDTIEETMLSVLEQDYSDIEYLVLDAVSTDSTLSIIEKYYDRLAFFSSEKDGGTYEGMNKGLRAATGDVIFFLNSGDRLIDTHVITDIVSEFQQDPELALVYGDANVVDGRGVLKFIKRHDNVSVDYLMQESLCHQAFFCRTDQLRKFGGFDQSYRIAADFDLLLKFILNPSIKKKYVSRVIVDYLLGGISSKLEDPATLARVGREFSRARKENIALHTRLWFYFRRFVAVHHKLHRILRFFSHAIRGLKVLSKRVFRLLLTPVLLLAAAGLHIYLLLIKKSKPTGGSKTVLILAEFDHFGGARTYFSRILEYYAKREYRLVVSISQNQLTPELTKQFAQHKVEVFTPIPFEQFYPALQHLNSVKTLLYEVLGILPAVRTFHPDLLFITAATQGNFLYSVIYPLPVIYVLHTYPTTELWFSKRVILKLLLGAGRIIVTVSSFSKEQIVKWWRINRNKDSVRVVYNFVGEQLSRYRKEKINRSENLILTIGHVNWYKDPHVWIETARMVIRQVPTAKFIWVGDGDLLAECREEVEDEDRIKFVGYKSQEEIADYYARASVYFQPSLMESFGISAADAMIWGVPVVASDIGGLPEVVSDRKTGYLVRPGNKKDMEEKIVSLLNDQDGAKKMGESGREVGMRKFSPEKWTVEMDELHKVLLD